MLATGVPVDMAHSIMLVHKTQVSAFKKHWRKGTGKYRVSIGELVSGLHLTENEAQLMMGFLAAQGGWDECLYLAACKTPREAAEYSKAGHALLNTMEHFTDESLLDKARYNDLLIILNQATYNGQHGIPCNTTTLSSLNSIDSFSHCLEILY